MSERTPSEAPRPVGLHPARSGALADDSGAVTAEYAVVLLAAVAFAGLLATVLRSGGVQSVLTDLVHRALSGA
jgi:hypothetical protein